MAQSKWPDFELRSTRFGKNEDFLLYHKLKYFLKCRSLLFGFITLCTASVFFISLNSQINSGTAVGYRIFSVFPAVANTTQLIRRPYGGIPKIIHQIWNNDVIPAVFHENIRGLVAHNKPPAWTYYFWTIDHGTKFIQKEFPRLYSRYSKANNLLKADILRLAVLYHFGGVYFDLDTVSVKPLDPYVETHNCSFVTDPPEHVFNTKRPTKMLLITNSALLCKPNNWFIKEIIEKLINQSPSCNDAVSCTGPLYISKYYELVQDTNRSQDLPIVDDNRYFEDKVSESKYKQLNEVCVEPFTQLSYEWAREICRQWIKRGREKRNISDIAYTYHTWFHTYMYPHKLKEGKAMKITEIVQNVTFYSDD